MTWQEKMAEMPLPVEVYQSHELDRLERKLGVTVCEYDCGHCTVCGDKIGPTLGVDPLTGHDRNGPFWPIYIFAADLSEMLCEDCTIQIEELFDQSCECGGDHDGGTDTCVLKETS